jgi:chorismate synthase
MLRFLTAGESHGPELTAILDGFPAGVALTAADIQPDMARRQQAYGAGGRMHIERDTVRFTGGVMHGHTTGAPVAMIIANADWRNWATKDIAPMTIPRPGHADLTGAIKYGYRDLRLALERASARETAARVAVGAVCKQLLAHCGITVGSYVTAIGDVIATIPDTLPYTERFAAADADDYGTRCPDKLAAHAMQQAIKACMHAKDTIGGIIEVVALGVPPGLGSYVQWDRRLDARLMHAVCSIPAIKGVEIGSAFEHAAHYGTHVHDPIVMGDDGILTRSSNHAGGCEGGISTGMPIVLRAAMKPISTTLTPMPSINLADGTTSTTVYERSDFCAVPRAGVVAEAMMAYTLATALLEKTGGDSLAEITTRVATLRRGTIDDLPMDNVAWRFGYDTP